MAYNVTIENVIAKIPKTRAGDSLQRAAAIYFLTGNTSPESAALAKMTKLTFESWLTRVFKGSPFGIAFGVTGVGDRLVAKVIAKLPKSRLNDDHRKAAAAFFATGNVLDGARLAGMTARTFATIVSQVFAGSPFGRGFDQVR